MCPASSASGFGFASNPGNFSTSEPEVPGMNGVTAPLNFFAQIGFERNGIFFPQGEMQGAGSTPSLGVMAPLAIELAGAPAVGPVVIIGQQLQSGVVSKQGTGSAPGMSSKTRRSAQLLT